MEERLERLIEFCYGIKNNENGKELYNKYIEDIKSVTPKDIMTIQYQQIKQGVDNSEMLGYVDKLINVFNLPLNEFKWEKPETSSFLGQLIEENDLAKKTLEDFKTNIKKEKLEKEIDAVKDFINELKKYNEHLIKLENILFPSLEKKNEIYNGLSVMWSLHDRIRSTWKEIESGVINNEVIGRLYFQMYGAIQKQEAILFPCATLEFSKEEFEEMLKGEEEYLKFDSLGSLFKCGTGHFTLKQLEGLLNVLPLDMTLVDENDKVAYFSGARERIFPRSKAIIGRDVRNCHPSESVHIVESILESFKKGEKDEAEFWINIKDKKIYIRYFPIRDNEGKYMGTLEVTQDITKINNLQGERRLLNW